MHREISHIDETFHQESQAGLYVLTGVIGLLIGLDLWPAFAGWLGPKLGVALPSLIEGIPIAGTTLRFALIAAMIGGVRILVTSAEGLLAGKLGADLALALAVLAAILINQPLVAAEVVFIGMVGECLEAFTFQRTQRAVRRLVEIAPRLCLVLRDGQEVKTRVEDVRVGECVLVRPGRRVPVDGVVLAGRSAVDQSTLTGESLPVDKAPGDDVFAGTLNQFGALTVEVRRAAEHTVMGQVIELTARALKDKAPLERTADRLARYFLPVVLGLALLTFLANWWWFEFHRPQPRAMVLAIYPALAVLVVACPCALILATPAAIIAALGRLAGTGVLIKGGAALERLARVDTFAFDKTGTLTEGRLQLGDVAAFGDRLSAVGQHINELIRLAATAEQRSEHLLGQLIVNEARGRGLELPPVEDFVAQPGAGVIARTNEMTILVGSKRLMEEQGVPLSEEALRSLEQLDATGQTPLLVARHGELGELGELAGIIGVHDRVRAEAAGVLKELSAAGVSAIAMLTGDRPAAARRIADQLGIEALHAELLPAQKADWVAKEREQGRIVAMVGDGINDAPALARADVGLALGAVGADVAAEAGDIVLMGDPLKPLPFLLRLSRKTVEIIRQNILVFAFGVNAVGILLIGWVLPGWSEAERRQSPIWAAIYHQIGSLAVLLNAMRLLWFERSKDVGWLRGLKSASDRVDNWLERLSFHELAHWLERHWKKTLAGLAAAALVFYLSTGLWMIRSDEIGIVQRFGRPLEEDLAPGLHVRLPWPWEQVTKAQPDRLRTVEVGYRGTASAATEALTWASPHGDGITRQREEALMMTGDGNLVEVQAAVLFTVRDPRRFLFEIRHADQTLRGLTESVLRDVMARRTFLALLTGEREAFQKEVVARLRHALEEEYDLGIELHGVVVQDLHPPLEVVDAYYAVTRAMSQKDRSIIEARRLKETDVSTEQVAAVKLESAADSATRSAVVRTEAERDAFLELAAAQRGGAGLPSALSEQLSMFRLYLEAAEEVLAGRRKVLRDPALPGKVHIYQMEPDLLRMRVPFLGRDRELQPPRGGHEGP